MMIYTFIFRPLECTDAVLDEMYWYKVRLMHENIDYIMGITYEGKLMYFEPADEEGGRDTWESVKKYRRMDNLVGKEHDFIINKSGIREEVIGLLQDLLHGYSNSLP